MEREDRARARLGIAFVTKEGLDAGGLVQEAELARREGGEKWGQVCRVLARLVGDRGKSSAGFLRFDNADRDAVGQQQIIAATGSQLNLPQGDPLRGAE